MKPKEMERKWQERWSREALFDSEPDPKRKKFFITVAYPYPSGGMHIGHVRTYTVPDIVARFKRMQGFNVLFPMAWHVTGTPIIGAVNRLKEKEPDQMRLLREVFKVSEQDMKGMLEPMGYAQYFIEKHYKQGMQSLGYTIDWRRQFTTNDKHYNRFIEWQHSILYRKGLEKKGLHPVKWCVKDKNPVTTHDLLEGESADIQEFTLVKFRYAHENQYIIAATLRPDALFGQTNLWVNPDVTYAIVKAGKERWIISKSAVEKLRRQNMKIKHVGELRGSSMVGKLCKGPLVKNRIMILPTGFIDEKVGTGLVYSALETPVDLITVREMQKDKAFCRKHKLDIGKIRKIKPIPIIKVPGMGEDLGAEICKEFGITSSSQVDELQDAKKEIYRRVLVKGVMRDNCGRYSGMKQEKAKELIKKDLIRRGKASTMLEFSEPVVCRCGGEVIVAKTESWFLDYSNKRWKSLARQALKGLRNIPSGARKDFEHTIEWLDKWPCVRNFGLGTPLPQDTRFMIEPLSDSTIYMAYYLVAHMIKRYNPKQLTPEFFDYVMLGKGTLSRVGRKTGIAPNELRALRESVRYWYPLDWRCSALELIPNHLTFMLFHHTAVFPRKQWPKGIATWGMGLLEGGKMSSSKGNVVLASDAIREYGADTVRFFLFSSTEPWQDFDWRASEVKVVKDRLFRWQKQVLRLSKKGKESEPTLIDRWLLSEVSHIIQSTTKSLESFETRKASLECFFRMSEAVRWYERRSPELNKAVLSGVLESWVKLMTPFVPHMCEELWESLGKKGFVSDSSWPTPDRKAMEPRLEKMEDFIRDVHEDITSILNIVKKKPKDVRIYPAPNWKHVMYNKILGLASTPEKIIPTIMKGPEGKKHGKDALRFAQRLADNIAHLREPLTESEELEALQDARAFLEKEFKCKLQVIQAYKTDNPKSLRAEPGKPGIEVIS